MIIAGDKQELSFLVCKITACLVLVVRSFYSFTKRSEIGEIASALKVNYSLSSRDYYFVDKMRFLLKSFNIFFGCMIFTIVLNPIVSYLLTGERLFQDIQFLDKWATSKEIYPFAISWFLWCLFASMFTNFAVERIQYSFIMVQCIELEKLRRDFLNLKHQIGIGNKLKKLIKRHNQIIDDTSKLEKAFSFQIFFFFYSALFLICFTAFQSSTADNFDKLIEMAIYSICNLQEIYIQSYFGEMLQNASDNLFHAVYACGWEEMRDLEVRKSIEFIVKRTRYPIKISMMGFGDVKLIQFANVSNFQLILLINKLI
jgi:hypothetical protein